MPLHIAGPNGKQFPITGIVDSGADVSLFPSAWAEPLGIQIADCETVIGGSASGGGQYHYWPEPIQATLLGKAFKLEAVFGGNSEVLLGREDFLAQFELRLDQKKRRFFLDPYS